MDLLPGARSEVSIGASNDIGLVIEVGKVQSLVPSMGVPTNVEEDDRAGLNSGDRLAL